MRHGAAGRRHRNRGHGGQNNGGNGNGGNRPRHHGGGNNRMQVFDSNGPDVRIRGTAHQVVEKYLTLAKDAASSGDRVVAESYLQHAEHYQRIISSWGEDEHGNRYAVAPPEKALETFAQPGNQSVAAPQGQVREDLSLPASILGGVPKVETQETV